MTKIMFFPSYNHNLSNGTGLVLHHHFTNDAIMEKNIRESKKEIRTLPDKEQKLISRGRFLATAGIILAGSASVATAGEALWQWPRHHKSSRQNLPQDQSEVKMSGSEVLASAQPAPKPVRVSADPQNIPAPVHRSSPIIQKVRLEAKEVMGEIEAGVLFHYMTFNGQVPAPMIRVREGDTVELTLTDSTHNQQSHNVDFHCCYGTGGGSAYTAVSPGESKRIHFKVMNPGAFIYHCAVHDLDYHISSGMFGLILVEPKEGLSPVDHEFYFGQNEIYVSDPQDKNTPAVFDFDNMIAEKPKYVVLNGEYNAITADKYGALKAKKGERIRIFFVNGGPNLISSFHPIGNIWEKFWLQGSLMNNPFTMMQTVQVNPGSCAILEMQLPVPEVIRLADHSITRTARQGLLAEIEVTGAPAPSIFEPAKI